jgi:hypothetical protein
LAEAVVRLLSDGDLSSQLVASGGARARAELTPSASLAAFQAEIDKLFAGQVDGTVEELAEIVQ